MSSTVSLLQLSITPCVIRVLESGAYELQGTVVQWDAAIRLCVHSRLCVTAPVIRPMVTVWEISPAYISCSIVFQSLLKRPTGFSF